MNADVKFYVSDSCKNDKPDSRDITIIAEKQLMVRIGLAPPYI